MFSLDPQTFASAVATVIFQSRQSKSGSPNFQYVLAITTSVNIHIHILLLGSVPEWESFLISWGRHCCSQGASFPMTTTVWLKTAPGYFLLLTAEWFVNVFLLLGKRMSWAFSSRVSSSPRSRRINSFEERQKLVYEDILTQSRDFWKLDCALLCTLGERSPWVKTP